MNISPEEGLIVQEIHEDIKSKGYAFTFIDIVSGAVMVFHTVEQLIEAIAYEEDVANTFADRKVSPKDLETEVYNMLVKAIDKPNGIYSSENITDIGVMISV